MKERLWLLFLLNVVSKNTWPVHVCSPDYSNTEVKPIKHMAKIFLKTNLEHLKRMSGV